MANDKDFIVKNAVEVGKDTKVTLGTISSSDIDLSTGNYFSDTLAANTTYTISNAGDVQSFQLEVTGGSVGYGLDNAIYDSKSFSVNAQEGSPQGLYFKSDGTKVYVVGDQGDSVDQFSLSTAWDISTASFDSVTFSLASQVTSPKGIFFKPDGTSFYVQGQTVADRYVYQYNMTTAWDISTASYASKSFSISSEDNEPLGLFFKSDGTKVYVTGEQNDSVYQYSLSTAWDASTGSYDSVSFDWSETAAYVNGLSFSSDGTKLFLAGYDSAASETTIFSYTLSTAWDLTTASYETSFSVDSQEPDTFDVQFSTDGTKMYIVGITNDTIYQYSTATDATITWPSSIEWAGGVAPAAPSDGETDVFTITTDDSGVTYVGVKTADNLS